MPPWEIDRHTAPIIWWLRWNILRNIVAQEEELARK